MAAIKTSLIFIWTGTNASIPAGWTRETGLDGLYVKGAANGADGGDTGGNATHTHTSPAHTHTMANHTHTINMAPTADPNSGWVSNAGSIAPANNHDHPNFASGNPNSVSVQSVAVTYGAVANDPPYHEVIFIKPSAETSTIPDGVVCFVDTEELLGMTFCNGGGSTPDLRNKFLKGAAAAGDAGGTGGSTTNVHPINHAHTVSHGHVAATSPVTTNLVHGGYPNSGTPYKTHTHSVSLPADSTGTGTDTLNATCVETVEPAYSKLVPVMNDAGGGLAIKGGAIAMYLGSLASIPANWEVVAAMEGAYLKCANATTESGDTGGANTHTHASVNHTHPGVSHTHTNTTVYSHVAEATGSGSPNPVDKMPTYHRGSTQSTDDYNLDAAGTTGEESSNEPPYKTVIFLKYAGGGGGGAAILASESDVL